MYPMSARTLLPSLALALGLAAHAVAQDEAPPRIMSEDAEAQADPTAPQTFRSIEAGLSLDLPPGQMTLGSELSDPTLLALVVNPDKAWRVELRSVPLPEAVALQSEELPEGGRRVGLIELTASELERERGADILRQDFTPLADADAGVIVSRYTSGPITYLQQEALVPVGEVRFFRLTFISPAPIDPDAKLSESPEVREAVAAFTASLDSLKLIDQSALREEQERRLLATRPVLLDLSLPGKLARAAEPAQWWRVRRGGEDIGYAQVIEEPANALPDNIRTAFTEEGRSDRAADAATADGVRVGIALRLQTGSGRIERRSWFYSARDLETADFRENNRLFRPGDIAEEAQDEQAVDEEADDAQAAIERGFNFTGGWVVGQLRTRNVPRVVERPRPGGLGVERLMDVVRQRQLDVTFTLDGEVQGDPMRRQLPDFYVPQAAEHLLPRLLAQRGAGQYMIAVYAPDRREIMSKYIDVGERQRLDTPGGEAAFVVPVDVRIGLAGTATRHFVEDQTWRWLGSDNPATDTQVIPSTRDAIDAIWTEKAPPPEMVK